MLKRIVTIQDVSCFGKCSSTVEYSLTELGYSLKPILDAMSTWGENYKENYYQD